ncbi:MAG: prepilin-type N-terminal cleavage/methylation domain-containing protein [Sulfuricaulis sp.]|nr:prepilin-type N-terminal cleavage/methylation domain-containing protein [Sulfuricaulis sp.]
MRQSRLRARGVTLVELIVSIVVIGVALAGVMVVIVRNTSASADPLIWHQAVIVGEAYLEEILTKNFTADGVEASRDLYDDVMDYNGLTDSPPRDQNGTAITTLAGYSVNVQVTTEALNDITAASGNAVRAQVTVTMPTGGSVVVSGYRTNYN